MSSVALTGMLATEPELEANGTGPDVVTGT